VLAVLWGLWEGWRAVGIHFALTWPFTVDDTTMPHLHLIFRQLFEPSRLNGPLLITVLCCGGTCWSRAASSWPDRGSGSS
jgi:hypothetical protein